MVPATAALSRPRPTKEEKEGSWPEPPPEISETVAGRAERERWWIILLLRSRVREGLRWGIERRAVLTRCVGLFMKCFAGWIRLLVNWLVWLVIWERGWGWKGEGE